jgi:hypothetical protein
MDIVSINRLDTENYQSLWPQTYYDVTDKNNNLSLEGLDIYYLKYHRCTTGLGCDTTDNVCLDLHTAVIFSIKSVDTDNIHQWDQRIKIYERKKSTFIQVKIKVKE